MPQSLSPIPSNVDYCNVLAALYSHPDPKSEDETLCAAACSEVAKIGGTSEAKPFCPSTVQK
jgi:hypothetical protein